MATKGTPTPLPAPPMMPVVMAAFRWQETGGNPATGYGRYNAPGGGAYQISPDNWPAWALKYARYNTTDPEAAHAPPQVQNQVAYAKLSEYYYGAGEKSWRLVARLWNGGTTQIEPVPGYPGRTSDTYANEFLSKLHTLQHEGYHAPPINRSGGGPGELEALQAKDYPTTGGCHHPLHIKLKWAPDFYLCMDKPIATLAIGAGGFLMIVGGAVVLIGAFRQTPAGRAASGALAAAGTVVPVARVATAGRAATSAARGATPKARQAKAAQAQADELRMEQEQLARDAKASRDRATIARNATPRAGRSRTAEELDRRELRPTSRARRRTPTGTRPRADYRPRQMTPAERARRNRDDPPTF